MQRDVAKARAHASDALAAKSAATAEAARAAAAGTKVSSFTDMFKDPEMLKAM
jgi:hypothetical protein